MRNRRRKGKGKVNQGFEVAANYLELLASFRFSAIGNRSNIQYDAS